MFDGFGYFGGDGLLVGQTLVFFTAVFDSSSCTHSLVSVM